MSRKAIPADTAGDVQAPPAPVLTPPAGFVECITTRPSWQGGQQVPVGTPVLLSKSDASYAESIGRVCRVTDSEPEQP
jgi:hypothetical protein